MTIFLDCEFNGFGGTLISIGMVSDDGRPGAEFYAVRTLPTAIHPWVTEHVIPVLGKKPEPDNVIQKRLLAYLSAHAGQVIVADWFEDLTNFLQLLSAGPGWAYRFNLDLKLLNTGGEIASATPHNALSDAHALMAWYQQTLTDGFLKPS